MMKDTANQIADTIEDVTRALAEWSVERHFQSDATLSDRFGKTWRGDWVAHVESRLRFLAQAVALEREELFAVAMRWTAESHGSKPDHRSDLELSLRCMRDVILEELPPAAVDITRRCIDAGVREIAQQTDVDPAVAASSAPTNRLALEYIENILSGDDRRAVDRVLDEAKSGRPIEEIYIHLLQPAMHEIGRLWHLGELSIAEEHLATATTRIAIARLRSYFPPIKADAPRVVSTTGAGDFHDLGLRMATDMLELNGWHAFFLGASVPADVLVSFIGHTRTDVLLMSISTSLHLRTAARTIDLIRRHDGHERLRILVGGSPFDDVPELWRDIGADGWGENLQDVVAAANRMIRQST